MVVGITSAHVIPADNLSEFKVDTKYFNKDGQTQVKSVLLILEKDTGRVQVLTLNQERVKKITIEAICNTPELLLDITSVLERHNLSIIYSKHYWGKNLHLDIFLRDEDVSLLVLDLEQLDGIKKLEVIEMCA